ncbi:MAG TPA: beta-galactosidase, partial [Kofleriaceae bacterium]|nr:beta-galactosidase [Kofleriaceae bacterium]
MICAVIVAAGCGISEEPGDPELAQTTPASVPAVSSPGVALAATHSITWDRYSLMIDGQRVFLWSGEFHPYRLPSPSLWRDVLQKLKANGYNAVSIYFDWGYHSARRGVYDFTGVR